MSEAEQEPKAGGEPEQKAGQQRPRVRRRRPEQTRDDTAAGWGEYPEEDAHERWLREQRPPHWD